MCRRGENIYKRKDGRYEGRYVIGKKPDGTTKFGYIFGRHYTDVRARLLQKKAEQISASKTPHLSAPIMFFSAWVDKWMDEEVIGNVKPSTFQTYENIVRKHLFNFKELTAIFQPFCRQGVLFRRSIRHGLHPFSPGVRPAARPGGLAQYAVAAVAV